MIFAVLVYWPMRILCAIGVGFMLWAAIAVDYIQHAVMLRRERR